MLEHLKEAFKNIKLPKTQWEKPYKIAQADCLDELKAMKACSIDSLVCDPPAGISFMGKSWDEDKGGRNEWIRWLASIMRECYRVMKPGAHGLVWALPRTSHWTATALENAGFDIRDIVCHVFGSGFPKSMNISKHMDQVAGEEREVIGVKRTKDIRRNVKQDLELGKTDRQGKFAPCSPSVMMDYEVTAPTSDEAKKWDGWGSALKPGQEHWVLIQKPISEGSISENVLNWNTGALNIDGCRVNYDGPVKTTTRIADSGEYVNPSGWTEKGRTPNRPATPTTKGRFPANFMLSHSPECKKIGIKRKKGSAPKKPDGRATPYFFKAGDAQTGGAAGLHNTPENSYGNETVDLYKCAPNCPIRRLDKQSGIGKGDGRRVEKKQNSMGFHGGETVYDDFSYSDSGGASRFFQNFEPEEIFVYAPKVAASERDKGIDHLGKRRVGNKFALNNGSEDIRMDGKPVSFRANDHPTAKSVKLMRYLCRLITPPGGIVLDPFMGSGSTGVAALKEGFRFIGVEKENNYFKIATNRLMDAEHFTKKLR